LWGLAHSGETGVVSIIRLLKKELDLAMALSGKFSEFNYFFFLEIKAEDYFCYKFKAVLQLRTLIVP
jgi:hypothetical protein